MAKANSSSSAPKASAPALPRIHTMRKQKVVLDADLAALYDVPTFRLNEAVKRNALRFPADFRFQLTREEVANLISQNAISSRGHGGLRTMPWVFTEHGCLMAATVLRSEQAVQMSLYLVRAFVQMREQIGANLGVLRRLAEIDKKLLEHDVVLREVVERLSRIREVEGGVARRYGERISAANDRRIPGGYFDGSELRKCAVRSPRYDPLNFMDTAYPTAQSSNRGRVQETQDRLPSRQPLKF